MFRLPLQSIIFIQLTSCYPLQRVDFIWLISPLSYSIHDFFCHTTSSRLYITRSGRLLTLCHSVLPQVVEDRSPQ